MRLFKRGITVLLILALLLSVLPVSSFAFGEHKEYTVMVYMVGSDLESSLTGGCASTDITEMITSGVNFDNVNVIVYTGGSNRWHLDIPNNKNCVLELNSTGYDIVASTSSNVNMADSATMTDFLEFTYENYPSDHYSLICWDHGGGPMLGFGSDEIYGGDLLTIYELENALAASPFGPSNKLDWLGFDACLMGSLEIADAVSDYADYLVASEESEPGCGWGYSFLASLNYTTDAVSICKSIIDAYGPHTMEYESMFSYDFDCTLSCMDLSQVDATISAMEPLWDSMTDDLQIGMFSSLAQLRTITKEFTEGYDLVDLNDLAEELSVMYPSETAALQAQLDNLVIHEYSDISNTCGVTIYYPYNNMDYYLYEWAYVADGMMAGATNYYAYLDAFVSEWAASSSRGSFLTRSSLSVEAPDEFTMQLTQEQVDNLAGAYYTILKLDKNSGGYNPVFMNVALEPDDKNVLHVPYDQDIFYCYTDNPDDGTAWMVSQVKTESERTIYTSANTRLYGSTEFNYYGYGPYENVSVKFYVQDGNTQTVIMSVNTESGELSTPGKNDISVDGWGSIGYYVSNYLIPTYNADGEALPYTQWETNGWTGSVSIPISDSFNFEQHSMSDDDGEYICQIILEDVSGNLYASDIVSFPEADAVDSTVVKTQQGEFTFALYGDHAELTDYTGTDKTLEIPSKVDGLPVTVIAKYAFFHQSETAAMSPVNDNETLESVTIPESVERIEAAAFINMSALKTVYFSSGLTYIGHDAFSRCYSLESLVLPDTLTMLDLYAFSDCSSMTSVTLPASLSTIRTGAFSGNDSMTEFMISENPNFTVEDGVLFNANKTWLISYPGAKAECYTVPEGVKVIGSYAFTGAAETLKEINFSSTLEEIEYYAFFGCDQLKELVFPDSLQSIGNSAFYNVLWSDEDPVLKVEIGANLSNIGRNAFTGSADSFTVSSENTVYSSTDGFLLNKQGDTLLICPSGKIGDVTIPDGVVTITANALDDCDRITQLIFPDSLINIDGQAGVPYNLVSVTVGKNLTNWENIARFNSVAEFIIDPENTAYTMVDGVLFSKDMTQLIIYPVSKFAETYEVPEGVISIAGAFSNNDFLKELILPSTLEEISSSDGITQLSTLDNLEAIHVSSNNTWLSSDDGLLYIGDELICCPSGKTGTITVRDGTTTIGEGAFGWYISASEVILPETVTWIRGNNFCNTHNFGQMADIPLELYLPDSVELISDECFDFDPCINIHCSIDSYAENFAKECGLPVITE